MTKLLLVLILSLPILSCEQTKPTADKDKERIDIVCNSFMTSFSNGKFDEAFELLKPNSVMLPSTIDTLKMATTNFATNSFPAYGKIRSYEFISEQKIRGIVIKRFYILKFDKYFLKFAFTLYNNSEGWTITSFEYNEELTELLH